MKANSTDLQFLLYSCTEKLIQARLGVSRTIYVNVDSPKLGFPYFNFLGGHQAQKKHPVFVVLEKKTWNIQICKRRLSFWAKKLIEQVYQLSVYQSTTKKVCMSVENDGLT